MTVKIYIWYPVNLLYIRSSRFNSLTNRDVGHVSMQINDTYISHRPSTSGNNFKQINLLSKLELFSQNISMLSNPNINNFIKIVELISIKLDKEDKEIIRELLKQLGSKNINKDFFKKYMIFDGVSSEVFNNYSYDSECKARAFEGQKKRDADNCIEIKGLNEDHMLYYYKSLITPKYHPLTNNCSTFIANIIKSSLNCSEYSQLCSFCSNKYNPESFNLNNNSHSDISKFFNYIQQIVKLNVFQISLVERNLLIIFFTLLIIYSNAPMITILSSALGGLLGIINVPINSIWTPIVTIHIPPLSKLLKKQQGLVAQKCPCDLEQSRSQCKSKGLLF